MPSPHLSNRSALDKHRYSNPGDLKTVISYASICDIYNRPLSMTICFFCASRTSQRTQCRSYGDQEWRERKHA